MALGRMSLSTDPAHPALVGATIASPLSFGPEGDRVDAMLNRAYRAIKLGGRCRVGVDRAGDCGAGFQRE